MPCESQESLPEVHEGTRCSSNKWKFRREKGQGLWCFYSAKKHKAKADRADSGLQAYLAQQKTQLDKMYEAEQKHQRKEAAALETLLRAQQEAEEHRTQAMQTATSK